MKLKHERDLKSRERLRRQISLYSSDSFRQLMSSRKRTCGTPRLDVTPVVLMDGLNVSDVEAVPHGHVRVALERGTDNKGCETRETPQSPC